LWHENVILDRTGSKVKILWYNYPNYKAMKNMDVRSIAHIPTKPQNVLFIDHPFCVAAYCRVSSPSDEQELSLETQVTYYTGKIESHTLWKNAGIFADTATSRNTKQRIEFKKLLSKCRAGKVDLILTKSISRFGRNSLDIIKILRELRCLGVDVYFDPAAQHIIEIYCALAQNESENKSHSIRWGIKTEFQTGTSGYQNFTCYGYRFDKSKQTLVIVPKEAKIVRLIFDLRLQGYSYGKISDEIQRRKIPSPTGKPIGNRECIRKMLCNEKYAGAVMLQKTSGSCNGIFTRITTRQLCHVMFLSGCREFNCLL
jgi:site-specific DNA recombinase